MSRHLVETTTDLVLNWIKSNLNAAILDVSSDRADNLSQFPTPEAGSYFIYPAAGYRAPALFVIAEKFSKEKDRGANHINAKVSLNVNAVVEDKDRDTLTRMAWRYQAALDKILDQTEIVSSDGKVKIILVVMDAEFSPEYTKADDIDDPHATFRKEVSLKIEALHIEGF